jgi:hypothetical protein
MSFGRNPFVNKAQAAEQKASAAPDDTTRARAHREAAHQWERAAERERPGKVREEYERHAAKNRAQAEGTYDPSDDVSGDDGAPPPIDPSALN